jgi:dUTPase
LRALPSRHAPSAHDTVVPARGKALVKTDLSIAIPEGTYARIAPRSGLAWKHFIDTGAGVRSLRAVSAFGGCRSPKPR